MRTAKTDIVPRKRAARIMFQKPPKITRKEAMQAANNRTIYLNAAQIAATARARGWIR
jgi:hypothetical protein